MSPAQRAQTGVLADLLDGADVRLSRRTLDDVAAARVAYDAWQATPVGTMTAMDKRTAYERAVFCAFLSVESDIALARVMAANDVTPLARMK